MINRLLDESAYIMNLDSWLFFASIAVMATVTPGPAVLIVMTHAMQYSRNAAIITILGNISGLLTLSLLSVLGVSSLLMLSATAFFIV